MKNVSDAPIGALRIDVWLYSGQGAGDALGQESVVVEDLDPDEEEEFFVAILDRDATGDVDDYEIDARVRDDADSD